jgi:hypothetical protein
MMDHLNKTTLESPESNQKSTTRMVTDESQMESTRGMRNKLGNTMMLD